MKSLDPDPSLFLAWKWLSAQHERQLDMFPIWLILGLLLILAGIFNRQFLSFLGIKPMSAVFINPNRAQSTRLIEKIGQWLVITLGTSFLVQGINGALPDNLSTLISFVLVGLVGLMILAMIVLSVIRLRTK
ncbi:MAG: hypothetical protein QM730_17610 [Anaerolineales bacterium]